MTLSITTSAVCPSSLSPFHSLWVVYLSTNLQVGFLRDKRIWVMLNVGYVSRLHEKINLLLSYIHLNPPYGNIFHPWIEVVMKLSNVFKIFCFLMLCFYFTFFSGVSLYPASILLLMFIAPGPDSYLSINSLSCCTALCNCHSKEQYNLWMVCIVAGCLLLKLLQFRHGCDIAGENVKH